MIKRKHNGFYWVRYLNRVIVAEWDANVEHFCYDGDILSPSVVKCISIRPLRKPAYN